MCLTEGARFEALTRIVDLVDLAALTQMYPVGVAIWRTTDHAHWPTSRTCRMEVYKLWYDQVQQEPEWVRHLFTLSFEASLETLDVS